MFSKENIKLDSSVHTYSICIEVKLHTGSEELSYIDIGISIAILGGINNIDFVHLKNFSDLAGLVRNDFVVDL